MKNLFKSKSLYSLLELFLKNKDKTFYLNEIANELSLDPANTLRELANLIKEGIIQVEAVKKKKYYSLNGKSDYLPGLEVLMKEKRGYGSGEIYKADWLLAEEIPNMCPFFAQIWLNCFVDEFASSIGKAYQKTIATFKGYHIWYYFDRKNANEVGERIVSRFENNPKFMTKVNAEIVKHSDLLRNYAHQLPEERLEKISSQKLWKYYKDHEDIHTAYYEWGWLPVAADMFCGNLTNKGKEILKRMGVAREKTDEYMMLLTQPTKKSFIKEEDEELMKIGIDIQKNAREVKVFQDLFNRFKEQDVKEFGLYTHSPEYERKFEEKVRELIERIRPSTLDKIQKHYAKYFYTKFLFTEEQGVYSFEHYLKAITRLVCYNNNLQATYRKDQQGVKKLLLQRQQLIKKLKLDHRTMTFFTAWGDFMVTKIYRRYAQIFALYKMIPILTEMANRMGVSLKQLKFMTSEEIFGALFQNKIDREKVASRVASSVYYAEKNVRGFFTDMDAKKAISFLRQDKLDKTTEIKGSCGCRGRAKGRVKIVNVIRDMQKMQKGDILVAISTQPDLLPAMKKAAAFITDQGGVTSHAAIVAREMNTPCVIGTKIATKVLKDGDMVEVDADKAIVKIIKQ